MLNPPTVEHMHYNMKINHVTLIIYTTSKVCNHYRTIFSFFEIMEGLNARLETLR